MFCESRICDEEEYQKSGELLKGELNLVLLPGIETVCLTPPPSTENNKELLLIEVAITHEDLVSKTLERKRKIYKNLFLNLKQKYKPEYAKYIVIVIILITMIINTES